MNNTETETKVYPPGTPIHHGDQANDRIGYVIRSWENENKSFMLGTGRMVPIKTEYKVVWIAQDATPESIGELSDAIIEPMIKRAEAMTLESVSLEDVEGMEELAIERQEQGIRARQTAMDETTAKQKAFHKDAESKIPDWAQSVIIAEMIEDKSDPTTDYWGHTTSRTIILAFSKHKRDLFPEMRQAALNHPETVFLHDARETAEHREKHSMGGGYYLKRDYRHDDGWSISKHQFYGDKKIVPLGEWSLPADKPRSDTRHPDNTMGIEEHTHTKKNFQMFIVLIPGKLDRDDFLMKRQAAKDLGGWYSRKWGTTPNGFAFTSLEVAEQFQKENFNTED